MKTTLLAATAIIALTAGSAMAATPSISFKSTTVHAAHVPPAPLYNQNSPNGGGISSQNFTSGSFSPTYNSAGADDFVVPGGQTWTVTAVDASGVYYNGYGPANSEVITFYKNKKGHPGAILSKGAATYTVNCTDDGLGNFTNCSIPGPKGKGQKLKGGLSGKTYWVSVVVNMPFLTGQGQWGFGTDTTIHGNEGNWQNPGGGFGTPCTTWDTNTNCVGIPGDYAFDLQGHL